jgi:peroxiredoxin
MNPLIQQKKTAHGRPRSASRSRFSRIIWLIITLALLVAIVVLVQTYSTNVPLAQTPGEIQQAPTFTLPTLAGTIFDLAQKRGHPVVLYFMGPCTSSLQGSQQIAQALTRADTAGSLALVIDVNSGDRRVDLSAFVKETGIAATAPIDFGIDTTGAITSAYQVQTLETTVVIDPQGQVTARHAGSLSPEQLVQIVRERP